MLTPLPDGRNVYLDMARIHDGETVAIGLVGPRVAVRGAIANHSGRTPSPFTVQTDPVGVTDPRRESVVIGESVWTWRALREDVWHAIGISPLLTHRAPVHGPEFMVLGAIEDPATLATFFARLNARLLIPMRPEWALPVFEAGRTKRLLYPLNGFGPPVWRVLVEDAHIDDWHQVVTGLVRDGVVR